MKPISARSCFRIISIALASTLISQCNKIGQEDLIDIPEEAFLMALIEEGVDKDEDGLISYDEAEVTSSLEIPFSNISDLSGIEAFVNLDTLIVSMNSLSTFDVSKNTSLRYLECRGCELVTLDISKNPELRYLDCSGDLALDNFLENLDISNNSSLASLNCAGNEILILDVSNNPALEVLVCGRNILASLDISNNSALTKLICNNNKLRSLDVTGNTALTHMITCGNQFTSLDLSKNIGLLKIGIDNMPSLQEVCVWTTPFPPPGVAILSDYSPNIQYTVSCIR